MTLALSPVDELDRVDRPDRADDARPTVDHPHLDLPYDRHRDGGGVIASRYLESVLTLR